MKPLSSADFAALTSVSRETLDRLKLYLELLREWQKRINLVSKSTLSDPWRRHFLDSAQVVDHMTSPDSPICDLGSGAGFPGMVLAILTARRTMLIESDRRKAAFLLTVSRKTETPNAHVCASRIESQRICNGDITARALGSVTRLLELTGSISAERSRCYFLKGENVGAELTEASKRWHIDYELYPSRSDQKGRILVIKDAERRD